MSNSLSAIDDDIDDYLLLCARYHEKPEYMKCFTDAPLCRNYVMAVNPYSKHAESLQRRRRYEQRLQ